MSFFYNKYPYQSTDELNLDWVLDQIQSLNQNLDTLEERVKAAAIEASKEYVDTRLDEVMTEFNALTLIVNELDITFRAEVLRLQDDYTNFVATVQAQLTLMTQRIDAFRDELAASIIGVNARTDLAIEQNNIYLMEQISQGIIDVKVINYFTGERVTIQQMFDYLATLHADNAITVDELIAANKTYTQYAAYLMSYTELARSGKLIIV